MRNIIFMMLTLCFGQALMVGQIPLYQQKSVTGDNQAVALWLRTDQGHVLGYMSSYGLFVLDIDKRRTLLLDYPSLKTQFKFGIDYCDSKVVGSGSGFGSEGYIVSENLSIEPMTSFTNALESSEVKIQMFFQSEDGPLVAISNDSVALVSIDCGETWSNVPAGRKLNWLSRHEDTKGVVFVEKGFGTDGRFLAIVRDSGSRWLETPVGGSATSIVRLASDSLYWVEGRRLFKGRLGDTGSVSIDSTSMSKQIVHLELRTIYPINDDSFMGIEVSGAMFQYKGGVFQRLAYHLDALPRTGTPTGKPRRGWVYVTEAQRALGRIVKHRIHLTDPPVFDRQDSPEGVPSAHPDRTEINLGLVGTAVGSMDGSSAYLFSHEDQCMYLVGSFIDSLYSLDYRRMLHAWHDENSRLYAFVDEESVVRVDSIGRGVLRRGRVHLDDGVTIDANDDALFRDRHLREWGLSTPARLDRHLVFGGPVVRAIALDGSSTDTLYDAPTSFASWLPSGRLATGWHDCLRLHSIDQGGTLEATETDTAMISIPTGDVADSMGFPSAVVQCTDGTLLASIQGTYRLDSTGSSYRRFRWGGILRSTDGGLNWQQVPLPEPESNYVMSVIRTQAGTMLATTMRMMEDSTAIDRGTGGVYQTEYTASDIHIIRSTDHGLSWQIVESPFFNGPWQMMSGNITQADDGRLYVCTTFGIQTSTDDGLTWEVDERFPASKYPVSVTLTDDGTMLIAATDGVYQLDQIMSVDDDLEAVAQSTPSPRTYSRTQLREWVESAASPRIMVVDLHGKTTVVKSFDVQSEALNSLAAPAVYAVWDGGRRSVILLTE